MKEPEIYVFERAEGWYPLERGLEARRPKQTKILNMSKAIEQPESGASLPPRTGSPPSTVQQLLDESLLGLPLRVECRNVPLGDTGDFEGLTEIQHGNGGTPVAEIWNSEEHQDKAFQYLAHAANVLPEVLAEISKAKKNLDDWFELDHPIPILIEQAQEQLRRAILRATEVKVENDQAQRPALGKDVKCKPKP